VDRRDFLRLVGLGTAALTAGGIVLVTAPPVRRYWQVPRNAPVGGRVDVHEISVVCSGTAFQQSWRIASIKIDGREYAVAQ